MSKYEWALIYHEHNKLVKTASDLIGLFNAAPVFNAWLYFGRHRFIDIHQQDVKDGQDWPDKQVSVHRGAFL